MSTTPTRLPVPSEKPQDLKFNSGKIDEFVTSLQREYEDRFGNKHYTIEGLRWIAQQAIAAFGYITLKSFQLGAPLPNNELTLPNQVLQDETDGEYYRWDGALPKFVPAGSTPLSTGGVGVGAWVGVGDAALRSDLVNIVKTCESVNEMLSLSVVDNLQIIDVKGFYNEFDGGGASWVRDASYDGGSFTGKPVYASGNVVIYNSQLEAYRIVVEKGSIDLRQIGASESENIDSVYSVAENLCRGNQSVKRIVVYGKYKHANPLVLPAGIFLDYVDYNYSYTKKITNNKSGLPTLTGSYGGDLVMDVDACIILDHGYGHRIDNFNIKCDAPDSVEHAIYHGFTRETNIAPTVGRIGESGAELKYKPMHGITAQQGFFHNYGNITAFTQKGTWNYILNTAGTGCNVIRARQSWNYDSTDTAIKFQAATNVSLGQQYCEGTKQRVYEFFGCTGVTIDVLSVDRNECNQVASALYSRNSQVTIGALTVNAVTVASGVAAKFIEHTVGSGIYGCLTINGITARTNQLNTPNLTTITKDNGGVGNNCVIRGMPIPPIGALGNIGTTDASTVSQESDTGIVTTPHYRAVMTSFGSQSSGVRSAVINGFNCWAATEGSTVLSSTLTKSAEGFEFCGGYGGTTSGSPLSSNRKWSISSASGNIKAAGTITNGATFADYAEYFENLEVGEIPLGTLVDLVGDKVVAATGSDFIGVISGTAGVALNSASLCWHGKYLLGSHGEPIYEEVDGISVRKENPDFSPEMLVTGTDEDGNPISTDSYETRESRPEEWSCVGLLGQVYVNVDETVQVGDWLLAENGKGIKAEVRTRLRVMKVTSPGIAKCLLS